MNKEQREKTLSVGIEFLEAFLDIALKHEYNVKICWEIFDLGVRYGRLYDKEIGDE